MRVAIDASNIRVGGGVTHLTELLRAADPARQGIERVIVWSRARTLDRIPDRPWLEKRSDQIMEANFVRRALWQRFELSRLLREAEADLLFVPGGAIGSTMRPAVTMCRNMLPFEWREMRRFGVSLTTLKLAILRVALSLSFRRADGTIFLTRYAHDAVLQTIGPLAGAQAIIPHGIDDRFRRPPRPQRTLEQAAADPLRILYVSIVDEYKHQWTVAEAVARLAGEGLPVRLNLVGPARPSAMDRLNRTLQRCDPQGRAVHYMGPVDYKNLDALYADADICVFASSCENLPNILLEGMAAALPIACSDRGPMPEVLGDAGLYFDPENASSIADAIRKLVVDPELRAVRAAAAEEAARAFSWQRCADETFRFLAEVVSDSAKKKSSRAQLIPK